MNILFNWSGGKDSAMALHRLLEEGEHRICCLLTTVSEEFRRISMHGIREELLIRQVNEIGIPLEIIYIPQECSMEEYDAIMQTHLHRIIKHYNIEGCAFGDIFLEDLRAYREKQLEKMNLKALFPLWNIPTDALIEEFIKKGFESELICVNGASLSKDFLGRKIDHSFVKDLPKTVDCCGENGEYHSFVYTGPIFKNTIPFIHGEMVERTYAPVKDVSLQDDPACVCCDVSDVQFYFLDLLPVSSDQTV